VTIISPVGYANPFPVEISLDDAIPVLRHLGARVDVILPDETSRAAIGNHVLDADSRTPAANAGRAQGRALKLGM
jgi:NTE family protein